MNDNPLLKFVGTVFNDIISYQTGFPTGTLSKAFQDFHKRRTDDGREILFDAIRAGEISDVQAATEDDTISIIVHYTEAMRRGAANRNLRLLAQVMLGLAQRDRLFSDEFNKYAEILSRMSRDQIFLMGRYFNVYKMECQQSPDLQQVMVNAWTTLKKAMVPKHFQTEKHIEVVLAQCAALGLMFPNTVIGGPTFVFSPLMDEITDLVQFEDALKEEAPPRT